MTTKYTIDLELTGKFNLSCVMCHHAQNIKATQLHIDDVESLIPILDNAESISLHGAGEILMHKSVNLFLEKVSKIVPNIFFYTNGTLLNEEKSNLILNFATNIKYFQVSMDAAEPDLYNKIRRKGNYDEVISNLIRFKELRDKRRLNGPEIHLNATIMRMNCDQILKLLQLSENFDGVLHTWQMANDYFHAGDWIIHSKDQSPPFNYKDQILTNDDPLLIKNLKIAKEYAIAKNLRYFHWSEEYNENLKISDCSALKNNFDIRSNGSVRFCCFQLDPVANFKNDKNWIQKVKNIRASAISETKNSIPKICNGAFCKYVRGNFIGNQVDLIQYRYINNKDFI